MKFALLLPRDIIDIKPMSKRIILVGNQDILDMNVSENITVKHLVRRGNLRIVSVDYKKPYIAVGTSTGVFFFLEESFRYNAVYTGRDTYAFFGKFRCGKEFCDVVFIMRGLKKESFGGAVEVAMIKLADVVSGKRKGVFSGTPYFFESPFIGFCEKAFLPSALSKILVTDVDGDSLDELILVSSCPAGWTVLIIKGNEETSGFLLPDDVLYPISIQKYDIDNDGQDELVIFSEAEKNIIITFAKIMVDEAIISSVRVDKSRLGDADRYWGAFLDTNGDGLPEILILAEKLPEEGKIMSHVKAFSIYADGSIYKIGSFKTLPILRVFVFDIDADGSEEILLHTINGVHVIKIPEKAKLDVSKRFFFPSYLTKIYAMSAKDMLLVGNILDAEKEKLFGIYYSSDGILKLLGTSNSEPISRKIGERIAITYRGNGSWHFFGFKENKIATNVSAQLNGSIKDVMFTNLHNEDLFLVVLNDKKIIEISSKETRDLYLARENEIILGLSQIDTPVAVTLCHKSQSSQLRIINLENKEQIAELTINNDEAQYVFSSGITTFAKENKKYVAVLTNRRILLIPKTGDTESREIAIGKTNLVIPFDIDGDNVSEFCIISSVGSFIFDIDGKISRLKRKPRAIDFIVEKGKAYALTSVAVDVLKLELKELLAY